MALTMESQNRTDVGPSMSDEFSRWFAASFDVAKSTQLVYFLIKYSNLTDIKFAKIFINSILTGFMRIVVA